MYGPYIQMILLWIFWPFLSRIFVTSGSARWFSIIDLLWSDAFGLEMEVMMTRIRLSDAELNLIFWDFFERQTNRMELVGCTSSNAQPLKEVFKK